MSKLRQLAESEGFEEIDDFLEDQVMDMNNVGICKNEDCDYTTEVEPDSEEGWCEECETNTVISGLMLAGII